MQFSLALNLFFGTAMVDSNAEVQALRPTCTGQADKPWWRKKLWTSWLACVMAMRARHSMHFRQQWRLAEVLVSRATLARSWLSRALTEPISAMVGQVSDLPPYAIQEEPVVLPLLKYSQGAGKFLREDGNTRCRFGRLMLKGGHMGGLNREDKFRKSPAPLFSCRLAAVFFQWSVSILLELKLLWFGFLHTFSLCCCTDSGRMWS